MDFTQILLVLVNGAIGIAVTVGLSYINTKIKNKTAADTLDAALTNSLGAAQAVADGMITKATPLISVTGLPQTVKSSLQYVLSNAGAEAAQLGVTQESLANKIIARYGLAKVNATGVADVVTTAKAL